MDWQSPTSHPLHMAQPLSELIKRHFFTSPDAREKRRRKEGEKKRARRGHTALSLPQSLGEWRLFTMPSPLSLSFHSFIGKKKRKKTRREKKNCISHHVLSNCFCHIKNNCPQVKNVPAGLQLFQGEKGLLKSEWLPGSQDPLEVVMKSATLASQLYVSIHNPSQKPHRGAAYHSHGVPSLCRAGPALIYVAALCHTLNLKRICSLTFTRVVRATLWKHRKSSLRASLPDSLFTPLCK